MRTVLSTVFVSAALILSAQAPEKGYDYYSTVRVKVFHSDGTEDQLFTVISDPVPSVYEGVADTISYELNEGDSVTAIFQLGNDGSTIGTYDASWPLHEELMYGNPVFEFLDIGSTSLGGDFYLHMWSFTDSAEFSFKLHMLGNPTHVVRLTGNSPLGLEEAANLPVAVFPNPFSSSLYLQIPAENSARLSFTDASGREIKTWECEGPQYIDLSDFSSGSYILSVYTQDQLSTFRLQKAD